MIDPAQTIGIAAILTVAMFARSAFGFGHGAFALPLLVLVVDIRIATPVLSAVSFIVGLWILIREWRNIRFGHTALMTVGAVVGTPIGVAILLRVDQHLLLIGLGGFLTAASLRGLFGLPLPELKTDRWAPVAGLLGGILGGAVGINGIPVAIYGAMRRWPPAEFRVALTGYFFVTSLMGIVSYFSAGFFSAPVLSLTVWSLIPAFFGNWLGRHANHIMPRALFERAVWGIILVTAVLLLGKEIWG